MTGPAMARWQAARRAVREFWAVTVELNDRRALLDRPWEQEQLHWAGGDLHGSTAPPLDGRRHGVTAGGWCPCPRHQLAAEER